MKKIFPALFILVALALAAIYYFIPGTLIIAEAVSVNCNRDAAFRKISADTGWYKWGSSGTGVAGMVEPGS